MTLREVCEMTGVSRRAIQGYERAGLVAAVAKNERGYLLYDQKARERIQQVKFFQEMGFSIKEIKEILDAPRQVLKSAIEQRIEVLWSEVEQKKKIIDEAQELLRRL